MGVTKLLSELRVPSDEFSPWPFWFLNDRLTPEKLHSQLADFREKGICGVVLHPRIGVPSEIEYLSEAFLDAIECAVDAASALSMQVVLYDEGMYPSGSAHGEVVRSNPAFASVGLRLIRGDALCRYADGTSLVSEPNVGTLYRYADGASLVFEPSGGTIRGIHFGEDDGEAGAPPSADILNPDAVDRFIALTHEKYYAKLRGHFGKTIVGVFTDEPCPLGRLSGSAAKEYRPWTRGLEADILREGGKVEELRGLFSGEENDTCRTYRAVLRRRLNETYYRKLSDWCRAHGVSLMGHPEQSDDIDEQAYFDVPGQDLIMRRVAPERGGVRGLDSVQAKCSADAARHEGKRRNSNECFGVCGRSPWDLRGSDMKWMIDYLCVRGVNLLIPHAFCYSICPPRDGERPPDVGPNNIWWKHYKRVADYCKRVCFLMTDSVNATKVCVPCESRDMPADEIAYLYENQVEFNYLPIRLLDKAEIGNGTLKIGGYEYSHYVPRECTRLPLNPAISGGERYRVDARLPLKPVSPEGELPRDLIAEPPCPSLRVTHVRKYGADVYFCVNEGDALIHARVTFGARGVPILYDPWRDELRRAKSYADGSAELRLPPFESVVILMDAESGCASDGDNASYRENASEDNFFSEEKRASDREGFPWIFAPADPLDIDITPYLRPISRDETDCSARYGMTLSVSEPLRREYLLVRADDMAECWVNGAFVGASFWNDHRFFAGNALRAGRNEIIVVVTGSASNLHGAPVPYGLRVSEL